MSKIAAAVLNRKGGVGKTTIAVILAEIALVRRNKVLAIDLDPSKNFTDALMQIKNSFKDSLRIKDTLEDSDADATEEWIVIDCPPNLDDASRHAIDFADIIVVPVRPDFFSFTPIGTMISIAEKSYGKSKSQLPVVKVGFDDSVMARVANGVINDNDYPVAEELPLHKTIPYNISTGRIWSVGVMARLRQPYDRLFGKIKTAVERLSEGITDVHEVWTGRKED